MYIDSLLLNIIIISILLNLLLPVTVSKFATSDEITPPNGASNLNFKQQLVHMLVHHAQVPLSSSFILALIIYLSYSFADYIDFSECINSLLNLFSYESNSCGI
tara:strand:- start:1276 stop:1587 length:312 start_codon:yes stop_codon:yes gene_type:complete